MAKRLPEECRIPEPATPLWRRPVGAGALLILSLGLVFTLLATLPIAATDGTEVGGPITDPTVWTLPGSPYYVVDTVTILDTASLTIEPGVEVQFEAGLSLIAEGPLTAIGTEEDPIRFTSREEPPEPKDWDGIWLLGSQNDVVYCQVEYGYHGLYIGPGSDENLVTDNLFSLNGGGGEGGAILGTTDHSEFLRNQVDNSPFGLLLIESSDNLVADNEIAFLESFGIGLEGTDGSPGMSNVVTGNHIGHNCTEGLLFLHQSDLMVSDNWLYRAAECSPPARSPAAALSGEPMSSILSELPVRGGMSLYGTDDVTATGNHVTESGWGEAPTYRAGVYISETTGLVFDGNFVHLNMGDGFEYAAENESTPFIHNNGFWDNEGFDLESFHPDEIDVTGNWWGTDAPTLGEHLSGNLLYDPWVELDLTADPTTLPADGVSHSELTVSMLDGTGFHAPDGLDVDLEASLGTLSTDELTMLDGLATAYLTAAASPGTAWLTATAPLPPPAMGIPIPPGRQAFASVTFLPLDEYRIYLPLACMNDAPGEIPCVDIIENGGFEYNGVWEIPQTDWPAAYTTKRSHTGDRSMRIGIANPANNVFSYSSARQLVTISADADSAILRFWLYTMVAGGGASGVDALPPPPPAPGQPWASVILDSDAQYVLILDENDIIIDTLLWQRRDDREWILHEFDLMDYAGETIKLHFGVFNNGSGDVTAMFLDDVSLEVCPEEPPPEPPDCYPWQQAAVDVGDAPHGVAVNSVANRIYVANHDENTLSKINGATYNVVATSPAGVGPNGVAYNPNNNRIYVAIGDKDKVQVRRADNLDLVKGIPVGSQPLGLAINPDTNRLYVSNYADGTVSIINGATNLVIETVDVGVEPAMIAVNPETNKAYVALHGMGQVAVIDGEGDVSLVDIFSEGPYGITVDTELNLVYVATIDTFRIVVVDGSDDSFVDWAEIRRLPGEEPVPLRMIGVNPNIGSSGHVFLTTIGEDGGWDKFLLLHKGWPEFFSQPIALDLNEAREGMAFDPVQSRVFVTSRSDDLLAVYLDGEPPCPYNFADEYQLTICGWQPDGTCQNLIVR